MSTADKLRQAIEALPEDQRGVPRWIVDPQTGTDGPLAAYIGMMDPITGTALADLLHVLGELHREDFDLISDDVPIKVLERIANARDVLEQAIERSQA